MNQPNSQPTSDLILRETASQTAGPYVHIGLALAAAPVKACDSTVDIVIDTSGASGFDNNGNDFDILRELVLLTGRYNYSLVLLTFHACILLYKLIHIFLCFPPRHSTFTSISQVSRAL